MTDDLAPLEPITNITVSELIATCGMCGGAITFEYTALDDETGTVSPGHAFDDCPQCGTLFDASAATFNATLEPKGGDT